MNLISKSDNSHSDADWQLIIIIIIMIVIMNDQLWCLCWYS